MTPQPTTPKPSDEQVQAAIAWVRFDEDGDCTVAQMDRLSSLRNTKNGEGKTDVAARILASALAWAKWEAQEDKARLDWLCDECYLPDDQPSDVCHVYMVADYAAIPQGEYGISQERNRDKVRAAIDAARKENT